MARRKQQSTSRPNKIGSTENPNVSRRRVQKWRSGKRASECGERNIDSGYEEIKILREDLQREGESMDKKQGEHRINSNPRATRTGFLEGIGFEERENSKRRSRKNLGKMPEWETTSWMVWMVLCRREGANTDIVCNIRVKTPCRRERIRVCRVL